MGIESITSIASAMIYQLCW